MSADTIKHCSTCKCGTSGHGFSPSEFQAMAPPEPRRIDNRPQEIRDAWAAVEVGIKEYDQATELWFAAHEELSREEQRNPKTLQARKHIFEEKISAATTLRNESAERLLSARLKYFRLQRRWSESNTAREYEEDQSQRAAAKTASAQGRLGTMKHALLDKLGRKTIASTAG